MIATREILEVSVKATGYAAAAFGTGNGVSMWVNDNATTIGLIISGCTMIATVVFLWLGHKIKTKELELREREIRLACEKDE